MAGYSDNREQNMEMKYLRKVLSEVDANIPVPESISGSALRHRLDDIKPGVYAPDMLRNLLKDRPRMLTWQSGLSYAVAFAFIIGLSYLLGINSDRPNVLVGEPAPAVLMEDERQETAMDAVQFDHEVDSVAAGTVEDEAADAGAIQESTMRAEPGATGEVAETEEELGVGGGGVSHALQRVDGYTYQWRANDPADVDKAGYPLTVDIINDSTKQLAGQLDIQGMQTVLENYLVEDCLVLVGPGESGVAALVYSIADRENPSEVQSMELPGYYVSSRLYDGVVRLATGYSGESEALPAQPLPGGTAQGGCALGMLNPATGEVVAQAYSGVDGSVDLHNISAYLTYTGLNEDGEEDIFIAQIHMDGMEISMGSISE